MQVSNTFFCIVNNVWLISFNRSGNNSNWTVETEIKSVELFLKGKLINVERTLSKTFTRVPNILFLQEMFRDKVTRNRVLVTDKPQIQHMLKIHYSQALI